MVAAEEFGGHVQYIHARNGREENLFGYQFGLRPYTGGDISVFGGATKAEKEVKSFYREVLRLKPEVAAIMAPVGVDMSMVYWNAYGVVDNTVRGGVMGSLWQIGVMGKEELHLLNREEFAPYAKTLGGRYRECGLMLAGDERGVIENRQLQHCVGMEAVASSPRSGKRLITNSCVGILSLKNVKS